MVEINLTIVIQVVQFLILVFVLNRILFRPISQAIEERDEKISAWEEKTRTLQETVRIKIESYEKEQRRRESRGGIRGSGTNGGFDQAGTSRRDKKVEAGASPAD
jgi:F-type H+-transporting ATPase subunit b